MTAADFDADVPLDLARAAHAGTSFAPEQRGEQERAGYAATLAGDFERLARLATTPEKAATLEAEFARYRAGYRSRYLAQLAARSRIVSTMIAGPSKFPAARMAKRNEVEARRTDELIAFRERALDAIRKALCPELRPIMAGDPDAVERLEDKIAKAEALQTRMKAANAAIRKHAKAGAEAQVDALVALGFTPRRAEELLVPDFCGRIGFADFEIKNNGANIRRMKERVDAVGAAKVEAVTEHQGAAARVEEDPGANRIRLFFAGKPSAEIRDRLKASGFRWTPSLGCWQAYRNDPARTVARELAA